MMTPDIAALEEERRTLEHDVYCYSWANSMNKLAAAESRLRKVKRLLSAAKKTEGYDRQGPAAVC